MYIPLGINFLLLSCFQSFFLCPGVEGTERVRGKRYGERKRNNILKLCVLLLVTNEYQHIKKVQRMNL